MKQRILEFAIIAPVVALLGFFIRWCYRDTLEEHPQYHADWLDVDVFGNAYDPITHEKVDELDPNDERIDWVDHRI